MGGKGNAKTNGKSEISHGAGTSSSELYDVSSFDPLQANAQQLTASAGMTNALSAQQNKHVALQHQLQQPTAYNPLQSIPQHPTSQAAAQHPYMLLNPGANPLQLQPIASAVGAGVNPNAVVSQAPIMAGQGFYLPGSTIPLPTNFPAQVLPGSSQQLNGLMPQPFLQFNPLGKRENRDEAQLESRKKHRGFQPSVVSVTTSGSNGTSNAQSNTSPLADTTGGDLHNVDVTNMTPAERRRHERNLREQQRSSKISQQVKELRDLLSDSNVPFKPNKYSILLNVVEYIKQLQGRAIMLDAEHKKLITTIRRTNEIVQSGNTPSSAEETDATNLTGNSSSDPGSENEMVFVQGLNYKSVFQQSPAALGVAALDGILLDCNGEFELLLGLPRENLLNHNLFNLVQNHEEMYRAMSKMLGPTDQAPLGLGRNSPSSAAATPTFWTGPVVSKHDNMKVSEKVVQI